MRKKILIVLTSQRTLPSRKTQTGAWLGELTCFYDILDRAGYEMDFVSPKGGPVPLDPKSLVGTIFNPTTRRLYRDKSFRARLQNTLPPDQVHWQEYAAIYYTGGHGIVWDAPENEEINEISREIYEHGGVVSAVCHGPAALVNVRLTDGRYLVGGKRVTGFSNAEEVIGFTRNDVPFLLQDELKKRGAHYSRAILPFAPHTVVDGRLVTGENPSSTRAVAKRVLELLETTKDLT